MEATGFAEGLNVRCLKKMGEGKDHSTERYTCHELRWGRLRVEPFGRQRQTKSVGGGVDRGLGKEEEEERKGVYRACGEKRTPVLLIGYLGPS